MPFGIMRRKKVDEGEAAGATVTAPQPMDRPAKRTRAAVAAAAAAAAAAEAQQHPDKAGKTESGAGSTQQVDRCASSNPAGETNSAQPTEAAAAPEQQQPPKSAAKRRAAGGTKQPGSGSKGSKEVVPEVPPSKPPAAKRRKLARLGVPAPMPRTLLQVPDRLSPPMRADDADGHYVFEIGENLAPRFKVMRKFGEGTFGQVLECWDRYRKDYVAVKVIRNIQKYRDAAKIELEVLATLQKHDPSQSRHCVRLMEWFDYRGHVCMVFERLGPSIYDYLRRNSYKPFPLPMARAFMRQMLESVAFMHSLSLVHTDLKPENVLVTSLESKAVQGRPAYGPGSKLAKRLPSTDVVRVIDFGSATFESDYHSSIVSTRHYRAPEIILGLGWSYPADMWSLGCILVELVTGDALFQTHENLEHLAMMQQVLGPLPPSMARQANQAAQPYFVSGGQLNWPAGAVSKKSIRAVQRLRLLEEFLYKHMDEGMRPHLDVIVDLASRLMEYEPSRRMTADEALQHPFFQLDLPASA